jgi:hypothetical protein
MTASTPGEGAVPSGEGVVVGAPRRWLSIEGLVLLAGALIAYGILGQPWWIVPAGILVPDIAMGGYLAGTRPGAHVAPSWSSGGNARMMYRPSLASFAAYGARM